MCNVDEADQIQQIYAHWTEHGWESSDVMLAVTAIVRAQSLIVTRVNALLRPFNLTFSRYEALLLLRFSRLGSVPLSVLSGRLAIHPASVTNTVNRLEDAGLIRRKQHPTDRRTTLAVLTEEGRQLVDAATAVLAKEKFGVPQIEGEPSKNIAEALRIVRDPERFTVASTKEIPR